MTEISLLPVSENGRPPYWNYMFGFDLYLFVVIIGQTFCIGLPNFIQIEQRTAEL